MFCCPPPRGTGRTNPPWHRGCSATSAAAPAPGCAGEGVRPRYPRSNAREQRRFSSASWHWVNACLKILNRKKISSAGVTSVPTRPDRRRSGLDGSPGARGGSAARLQPRRVGAADLPSAPKPPLTERELRALPRGQVGGLPLGFLMVCGPGVVEFKVIEM